MFSRRCGDKLRLKQYIMGTTGLIVSDDKHYLYVATT